MRSSWKVVVAVGLLVFPQLAAASDEVEEQLLQMQERMNQLEEKLAATSDQLDDSQRRVDEQEQLIERAGLEERGASSGIASFFEQVEFGGWIAASYWYNFNGLNNGINHPGSSIGGGANSGSFGTAYPFHPDHNTFQLDQLWFEMEKAATEDSRGGFGADILMGKTADRLVGSLPQSLAALGGSSTNITTNGNSVAVYQAYAEWLAPVGPGLKLKGGRFATHVGAEVAQTVYNFNITRGLVYSVLQPINHVGLTADMSWDNGFSAMIGVANTAVSNTNTDFDNEKAILWSLGYDQDAWGIKFNGLYGGDTPGVNGNCGGTTGGICRSSDRVGLLDFVVNWDPSENLSTWLDLTHQWYTKDKAGAGSPWGLGLAAAGRLAITEATGFAMRFEWLWSNDNFLYGGGGTTVGGVPLVGQTDQQLFSLTGTVDHALTENLMVKGEARYDSGTVNRATNDNIFYYRGSGAAGGFLGRSQVVVGAEMTYRF
jgi:hypothetical protein